jgi:multidrug efflux pump subunit AcrA (membrane-fusion protein)
MTLVGTEAAVGSIPAGVNLHSRLAQLPRKFQESVNAAPDKAVGSILAASSEEINAVAAIVCQPSTGGSLTPTHVYASAARSANDRLLSDMMTAARTAASIRCLQAKAPGAESSYQIVAAPIVYPDRAAGAVVFCLPPGNPSEDHAAAVALYTAAWLCVETASPPALGLSASPRANDAISTIYRLCAQASAATDFKAALVSLVNDLRTWLQCDTVCIVLARGIADARVAAISNVSTFDRRSALVASFEAAARETMLLDREQAFPNGDGGPAAAHLGELCRQTASQSAWSWPCHDAAGKIVCICVALLPDGLSVHDVRLETISQLTGTIGATVRLLGLSHASALGRMLQSATTAMRTLRRGRYFALAGLLIAILMFAPYGYDLPCDCIVEPVTRRFVCAPFDGVLDRTLVRPGDRVKAGDILAIMDGHELNLQLASRKALIDQSRQRHTASLAKRDASAAQLAALELEQAEQEVNLLNHRQKNLEIRSPLDGIVVSGDLHRAEGAPLAVGQKLFEVAPLQPMVVEASVPEHEVAAVAEGQIASLSLDSHPGVRLHGVVLRLHPQAEIRDQKSVFIAEVQLDSDEVGLLPGMSGQAQIEVGSRSVAWILFHRPWYYVRSRLLW